MAKESGDRRTSMSLYFLLVVVTSLSKATPSAATPDLADIITSVKSQSLNSLADLNAYANDIRDLAHLHISKSFSVETRRYKRDLDVTSVKVKGAASIFPVPGLPSTHNASALRVLSSHDKDYWILGFSSNFLFVLEVSKVKGNFERLVEFHLPSELAEVDKITGHLLDEQLWLAVSSSFGNSVYIVVLDLSSFEAHSPQTIPVEGVVGALYMFDAAGELYLAVGARDSGKEAQANAKSRLYRLHGKYFDRQDDLILRARNVQDIGGFSYRGNFYLVFGVSYSEGSQVYKLDPFVQTISLLQQLPDSDVYKVVHYVEAQENKHYIITMNNGASPKIYWWTSEQLLLWQVLDVDQLLPFGRSVNAFTFPNLETVLLLSSDARVTVYTDDISAHFSPDFILDTECAQVDDLFLSDVGGEYILVYVCHDRQGRSKLEARKVQTEEIALELSENDAGGVLHCLEVLRENLDERKFSISYFDTITENDVLMATDRIQDWLGPVTFSSGFSVNAGTTFHQMSNIQRDEDEPTSTESFLEFSAKIFKSADSVQSFGSRLSGILYHSGNQVILGPIATGAFFADRLECNVTSISEVNDMAILEIKELVLMDNADQTMNGNISVYFVNVDSVSTQKQSGSISVNGVYTHQFMQKSQDSQEVTGSHTYEVPQVGAVKAANISLRVNEVNTSSLVLKGSSVSFLDKKTLQSLIILNGMETNFANDVNMGHLGERLVFKDVAYAQVLRGSYALAYIKVNGNLDVDRINGVDVKELDLSAVKTLGDFTLLGNVAYRTGLAVGDVTTTQVNGVRENDIIKGSSTRISGNFHFENCSVSTAVSGNVNDIDLSQDVVFITSDQLINGRVKFGGSVRVIGSEGVEMSEGATVNSVDPSSLKKMDYSASMVISDRIDFTSPLAVSGDVVVDRMNDITMDVFHGRYWRKSQNQTITVTPLLDWASFQTSVNGESINNRQMVEFWRFKGPQDVSGFFTFQEPIFLDRNLNVILERVIDGVDVSSLGGKVVRLTGDQIISGRMVIDGKVVVEGDLSIDGRLNGWDVASDLVRLDHSEQQTGHFTFMEATRVSAVKVLDTDVVVTALNGQSVEVFSDIVLMNDTATVAGPLGFVGAVTVSHISVSGSVDGADIDDLVKRGLQKSFSESQSLSGRLTVNGNVHFHREPSLHSVNDKDWTQHLRKVVLVNYNGTVRGRKRFLEAVSVSGEFDGENVDGVRVASLAPRILTKGGEQTVVSIYVFDSGIASKKLEAPEIDGVIARHILRVDHDALIDGETVFAGNLSMREVLSKSGLLDGCDVLRLNDSAASKGDEVEVFLGSGFHRLVVKQNVVSADKILTGNSEEIDIQHFLTSLILIKPDQQILREAAFLSDVQLDALWAETVDGVGVRELFNKTVLDHENTLIRCDIQFIKDLEIVNTSVNDSIFGAENNQLLVNAVNISSLSSHAVLVTSESYFITNSKMFVDGFSAGSLEVVESLGSTSVMDLVLVPFSKKPIGTVDFTSRTTVDDSLQVTHLLDGVKLAQLMEDHLRLDANWTLLSPCTFEEIIVEGDFLMEKVNDVRLSDIVAKSGRPRQEFSGNKVLNGGILVDGKIDLEELNGMDMLQLNRSVVGRDKSSAFGEKLIIENLVKSEETLVVHGPVNGFGIPDLDSQVFAIKRDLETEGNRILDARTRVIDIQIQENLLKCGLFEKMSYGELISRQDVEFAGKISYGQWGNEYLVSVMDCDLVCTCDTKSALYQITEDGNLQMNDTINNQAVLFFKSNAHEGARLEHECFGPLGFSSFRTKDTDTRVILDDTLGLVADISSFTSNHNGQRKTYVVTAGRKADVAKSDETTWVSALRLEGEEAVKVWSSETHNSAATVDVKRVNDRWYMLVANSMAGNNPSSPYSAPSHLYEWIPSEEKFLLTGEYMGDHVTSAIFLSSSYPMQEHFFTLAQLKAAEYSSPHENVKYSTKVLVFRFDESTSKFKPYESLASYGVVAQEFLSVGDELYLFLLSAHAHTLDVYEYRFSEGFRLFQQMSVCSRPIDLQKLSRGTEDMLLVSCRNPDSILTFRLNTEGVFSL